jgi:predicted AAA+ superfamily ATPase
MISRKARTKLLEMATKYLVLLLTGPRQSGKTILSKMAFPNYHNVNLDESFCKEQIQILISED